MLTANDYLQALNAQSSLSATDLVMTVAEIIPRLKAIMPLSGDIDRHPLIQAYVGRIAILCGVDGDGIWDQLQFALEQCAQRATGVELPPGIDQNRNEFYDAESGELLFEAVIPDVGEAGVAAWVQHRKLAREKFIEWNKPLMVAATDVNRRIKNKIVAHFPNRNVQQFAVTESGNCGVWTIDNHVVLLREGEDRPFYVPCRGNTEVLMEFNDEDTAIACLVEEGGA